MDNKGNLIDIGAKEVYKIHNLEEFLFKLQEMFHFLDLDISFDFYKKEAYLNTSGSTFKMKNKNNFYYFEKGDLLIGFDLKYIGLMFDQGVGIDVIVSKKGNLKALSFKQGTNADQMDKPCSTYVTYEKGHFNQISSDGNAIKLSKGNKISAHLARLIHEWGLYYSNSLFSLPLYSDVNYGCSVKQYYDALAQDWKEIYVPYAAFDEFKKKEGKAVSINTWNNNLKKQEYSYKVKSSRHSDNWKLAYYKIWGLKPIVDSNFQDISYDNPACLDACLDIIKTEDAQKLVEEVLNSVQNEHVYEYLTLYYGPLLKGIVDSQESEAVDYNAFNNMCKTLTDKKLK